MEMLVEDGIYYVVVEGISRSYELDILPESRSFQNKGATYTHVIKQLVQGHPKGDAQNEATEPGATIGELIVQYQETNWQFMKRLASRVGTVILPDLVMDAPRIYFGVPDLSWGKDMKAYSYTMMQDMGSYLSYQAQAAGNESLRLLEADCIQYQVKSKYHYQVGENVGFKRQIWVIYGSMITYDQGSIQYEYILVQRKAVRRKSKLNQAIQGVALEGKVVSRANNMVKVHLDIDALHDEAGNWWFPYSAEGNNIFHSLPDEGAKVKVYFPSGIEKQAIAVNSARGASEEMISRTVFQKPTTKVFHIPGNTKMELGENGVLFKKDTVKINLEGGNIQVEASEDLLINVKELKLNGQKEKKPEENTNQSNAAALLPRSIKLTAKNLIAMQVQMDQYILITNSFVGIRSKKIDFNKVDIPFVDMLAEDELKELYVEELFKQDKNLVREIQQEKWNEKKKKKEKEFKYLDPVEVSGEEIKAELRARVNEDPAAIKNAKARLGKKDQNELQAKYLSRGKQESAAKSEEKSEEELTVIKNNYVTRYNQTNKLMSASYGMQNAKTEEDRAKAYSEYTQVFEEMQKSGLFANDAEGKDELSKYFSKNVPEMLYYSRFNFERIVISGQYGSVLMGVFFVATGIIAIVASAPSAGNSVILWSLMVGDVVWSAGQMYVSLEKLDDLGKGYANTEPEIFGLNQSDLDNLGLLLTALNLSILAKHGVTKLLDSATDANRIKLLEGISFKEAWPNLKQNLNKNLKEFFENLKKRRIGTSGAKSALEPKLEKYVKDSFEGIGKEAQDNFNKYLRENVWCDETLSNADKIEIMKANFDKLTPEQRINFNVSNEVRVLKNVDFSNWGEWPDIDWPSFPGLRKDTAIGVYNKETGEILIPRNLDRIGSPYGNNLGIVEHGQHATQNERSICYIENEYARNNYHFDKTYYKDAIDAIKDFSISNPKKSVNKINSIIDQLNKSNGTAKPHITENTIANWYSQYKSFQSKPELIDLCNERGIDSTYGVIGEAAPWNINGEVITKGGAGQLNTPINVKALEDIGIIHHTGGW
ncbi:MAG: hypothetical protein E6Z15_01010 [Paenibacillus macerans]|nr:hypothetical protein [Paenibacillus macerans]